MNNSGLEFLATKEELAEVSYAVEGLGLIMALRMRHTAIQQEIARLEAEVEDIELRMKERGLIQWF